MYKLGLKLWSTNKNYIKSALELYEKKLFDYIELFSVPDSYDEYIHYWKNLDIPFIIHAPHSAVGLNFAKKEMHNKNIELAKQAQKYADSLNAKYIIFHPGVEGNINNVIFHLKEINDSRALIENMPFYTIDGRPVCIGYSPEEIKRVLQETKVNFCFDLAHAIHAANGKNLDKFNYLKEFSNLNPKICHISDGSFDGILDAHKNLGQGTFDFEKIVKFIPNDILLSIETKKNFTDSLCDFEQDILFLSKKGIK